MRTLHRILDINKDGVVSFDDFKLLTEKFTDLGHLTQEHHDEFQEKIKVRVDVPRRGTTESYLFCKMICLDFRIMGGGVSKSSSPHLLIPLKQIIRNI